LAPRSNGAARRAENRGRLWLVVSYLLCPCHLPVTLGLVAAAAGGTAIGAALTANAWRFGAVLAVLYGLALWRGFHHLRRAEAAAAEQGPACTTRWCET
jgi:mercuric ion transport protein